MYPYIFTWLIGSGIQIKVIDSPLIIRLPVALVHAIFGPINLGLAIGKIS